MRNKPGRKHFVLASSTEKHDQSENIESSECHDNTHPKKAVCKATSFRKKFSQACAVYQGFPKYRDSRMFKYLSKKSKHAVEQGRKYKLDDIQSPKSGLKSHESNVLLKMQKKQYKVKHKKGRLKILNSGQNSSFPALKRTFSLRLKSRTDSHSEKVDLSSLVKMVHFQKTGRRLATKQQLDKIEAIPDICEPDFKSLDAVKQTFKELNSLSPTCGDMYGADEDGIFTFSFGENLSGKAFHETCDILIKDTLETRGNNRAKPVSYTDCGENVGKFNINESESSEDNDNSLELSRKYETYYNLTFHLDESSRPLYSGNSLCKTNLTSIMPDTDDKTAKNFTSDIPLFSKKSDNDSCDIIIKNFGNPWVLKSNVEENIERSNSYQNSVNTESQVEYESLGFSINASNTDRSLLSPNSARRTQARVLKRSTSIESLDSFSSSIHSVKSEERLFSSDSEDGELDDNVSISSSDSFTSAKDYLEQGELDSCSLEKIKRASSLDGLDKVQSQENGNVKHSDISDDLNTTPKTESVKHIFSVDDVLRIIQRPKSLSFSKGFSLDSTSKTDKTPKGEKKKVKTKRRSLDSAFKTVEIRSDFKSELEKQNLKSASSDSGLSSVLSPVQENVDVKLRSRNTNDTHYYTLPNPRKSKSYPPLLPKRKQSRIGSLSKMLSEKADSFSALKLGTSFKLRNLEKPITLGLNKTKSLTSLMSRKGSAVVSSISSVIRGKSISETNLDVVDSPFKPRSKNARRTKEEEKEFVYEKVKVLVPRKRPANAKELAAERKRLTLDLKLANIKQKDSDLYREFRREKKNPKGVKKGTPASLDSSSSVSSVKSPTMLDEIMKSVDTRRFSRGLALEFGNMVSDTEELDDTSSKSSSTGLLNKKRSIVSDITTPGSVFLSGEGYFSVCPNCKKMRHSLDRSIDVDDISIEKRKTQSLVDVNSCCACLALRNSNDIFPFVDKDRLQSHDNLLEDSSQNLLYSPCAKKQTSMSLQELSHFNDIPFQNYVDEIEKLENRGPTTELTCQMELSSNTKSKIKARRSLPYSLAKYQPCLDLSADGLDEIGSIEDDTARNLFQKTAEKSHSCGDLLDNTNETEPVVYSGKPLERKPSKREDRPVKVKSLSSSHDALTCLSSVDIQYIDIPVKNDSYMGKAEVTTTPRPSKNQPRRDPEESSDSGNEDCHSMGSESERNDFIEIGNVKGNEGLEILEHTPVLLENSIDSGLTMPDSKVVLNYFENIKTLHDISDRNANKKANSNENRVCQVYELNSGKKGNKSMDLIDKEIKYSGYLLQTKEFLDANKQNLDLKRQCFSADDLRDTDYFDSELVIKEKSASVAILAAIKPKFQSCDVNENVVTRSQVGSEKLKTSCDTGSLTETNLLHMNQSISEATMSRFLFDDQHINAFKNLQNKSRLKSVSSRDVSSESQKDTKTPLKLPAALSLDELNQKKSKSPNYIHDKLCIDPDFFPPHLSPLNGMFSLPPFQGFSAFSPPPDGQLPELEEVYKYDICLGYLIYSITCDNQTFCVYSLQRNKQLMEGVITPISGLPGSPHTRPSESSHGSKQKTQKKPKDEDMPNPAAPITVVPSEKLSHAGHVLRTVLLSRASHMIRDRKFHLRTYRRCMVGTEMVDWLLQQSSLVHSRTQAVGMWQALVEEGVIVHVCHEHQFKDKYLFYRFREDDQGVSTVPSNMSKKECEEELQEVFLMLAQIGPDAMMRMILRKLPHERTAEDLEIIYEELLHIKALSHLSTMVKRELASVLVFESHAKAGTVLFNQGDEGKSWYIILKGSVNVVIYGKGVVCTLHEGDDFGKLALVNDAPRAATIVLRDDNCHFLRVDKDDFNRILRDVEANTVRLKEHGQDVLVLEKIPTNTQSADGTVQAHYKYSIMAGTPEKMLEHLLETRLDSKGEEELGMFRDGFLEDFLLTHVIFMPCNHLCPVLLSHYHSSMSDSTEQENFEFMLNHKKCVLHFVQEWAHIIGNAFREDHTINAFLEELHSCVLEDQQSYTSLREDAYMLESILEEQTRPVENQLLTNSGTTPALTRKTSKDNLSDNSRKNKVIKAADENIFKVYCADHTYCTLKLPMDATVALILSSARDKLCLGDDLVLCEVKSTGERVPFKENDLCVTSGLSINGRLFITPREHLDALTPLPEQEGPSQGSVNTIELVSSREMAYYMTVFDWELFSCVQEYELIYQVFGRYKFRKITANLDLFLRRFNEIQFWVVTEMVLTTNLSKRVALLRKFIKLASYCKDYQNLNSFFAIVMGLSNIAVSRLSQTWEKLPGKFKKMFADFETLMDPSRNHRVYRLSVAKMVPPIIPFMPLLMKDMTFTHEGNKTYFDGLVNFEKMHMIAQTLKTVRFCRSSNLELEVPSSLKSTDVSHFIKNLHVIDNQRHLTQLSHKLEPRKT